MSRLTFFIYLDACRRDYISEERTPFLNRIGQEGYIGRIQTVAGFTQEVAMLTGRYPQQTNCFTWYRRTPDKSPFAWLRPFRVLRDLPKLRFYGPVKVGIRTATKFITGKEYPDPSHIPIDLLPYFERIGPEMTEHLPSLDSICLSQGQTCLNLMNVYAFINTKSYNNTFETVAKSIIRETPNHLYLLHIGELDGLGHKLGPRPDLLSEYLRGIDNWVEKIYHLSRRHNHTCNLIIVSDHGMTNVIGSVNIADRLARLNSRLHEDYFYFLDSTMARFWFTSTQAQSEVEAMLHTVTHGHIVTTSEKDELHINFRHNLYGDVLFWADKGYIIFPNFFQAHNSSMPCGMHGYTKDTDGVLILHSDDKTINEDIPNPLPLVDVFPLALDIADLIALD